MVSSLDARLTTLLPVGSLIFIYFDDYAIRYDTPDQPGES